MSSRTPTNSPFSTTATRRLLCLVIRNSAVETKSSGATQMIGWRASGPTGLVDRLPVHDRRVDEIAAGQNAGQFAVAHEQRIGIDLPHPRARSLNRIRRVDERRRVQEQIADTRVHERGEARRLLLARNGVELARDVEIEERGEAGVLVDEPQRHVAGQEVAERLLAGDEGIGASALHQRAAVERIARTAQRDDFIVVALLDAALDDDEQAFGSAVARDDRFSGRK